MSYKELHENFVSELYEVLAPLGLAEDDDRAIESILADGVKELVKRLQAAELLREAAAQVLACLPTSPDFHARLVGLAAAKRAVERGEGASLHKALLMAARAVLAESQARAAVKQTLRADTPSPLRAAMDAHDAAERLIDLAAEGLGLVGFTPDHFGLERFADPPPPSTLDT